MRCMRCQTGEALEQSTICRLCEEELTRARVVQRETLQNIGGQQQTLVLTPASGKGK